MVTSLKYDLLVEKLMGHKVTQLTESECKAEIEEIQGGAKSMEGDNPLKIERMVPGPLTEILEGIKPSTGKRRGRPKGSKNKSKAKV